jgi:hypothetical protein
MEMAASGKVESFVIASYRLTGKGPAVSTKIDGRRSGANPKGGRHMNFYRPVFAIIPLTILFTIIRCSSAWPLSQDRISGEVVEDKTEECTPISISPIHFTLGHGDELQIAVQNTPELDSTVTVNDCSFCRNEGCNRQDSYLSCRLVGRRF